MTTPPDYSTFFLVFSLVSSPSGNLLANAAEAENKLLVDLFREYHSKPSIKPIEITPDLRITNVQAVDEDLQTMKVYAIFKLHWRDPRLAWKVDDYGGLREVTKPLSFFQENNRNLSVPMIFINHIGYGAKLIRYTAQVSIRYDGIVTVMTSNFITSTCFFTFGLYPNDFQNCSFQLFTSKYADELRFSRKSAVYFGADEGGKLPHVNEFMLYDIDVNGGFLKNRKFITELKGYKRSSIPIFNFNIIFKRVNVLYFVEMATPVLCQTLFLGMAGIAKGFTGLFWLLICLVYEISSMTQIFDALPPDYNDIPLIGMLGLFLLFETVGLMIWRTFTIHIKSRNFKNLEVCEDGTVLNPYLEIAQIGDGIITVLLIVQMILNTMVLM